MPLEERVKLSESQTIKKEDLYLRWEHATKQEIVDLCKDGDLRAYQHRKGPINGVLFCVPAHVYGWNGLYHDEDASYFHLGDVERCEKEYPDFLGNVGVIAARNFDVQNGEVALSPRAIEVIGEINAAPQDDAGCTGMDTPDVEEIQIDEIRKAMMMSPQNFVDFLNCSTTDNRLITAWEEGFRQSSVYESFFTREDLQKEDLTVHKLDWEDFQRREKENKLATPPNQDVTSLSYPVDDSDMKAPLAEVQRQLTAKDARIIELEKELAAASAEPAATVNATKWENSVKAAFAVWAEIVLGDKTDWIEDEFRAALAKRYSDYHTKVHALGWSLLPDEFKNGRGRRKKNSEKSQQSDNY